MKVKTFHALNLFEVFIIGCRKSKRFFGKRDVSKANQNVSVLNRMCLYCQVMCLYTVLILEVEPHIHFQCDQMENLPWQKRITWGVRASWLDMTVCYTWDRGICWRSALRSNKRSPTCSWTTPSTWLRPTWKMTCEALSVVIWITRWNCWNWVISLLCSSHGRTDWWGFNKLSDDIKLWSILDIYYLQTYVIEQERSYNI